MVGLAVSDKAAGPPYFSPRGVEIDPDAYVDVGRDCYRPCIDARRPGGCWFGRDGATSHASAKSAPELGNIFKKMILQSPPTVPIFAFLTTTCGAT